MTKKGFPTFKFKKRTSWALTRQEFSEDIQYKLVKRGHNFQCVAVPADAFRVNFVPMATKTWNAKSNNFGSGAFNWHVYSLNLSMFITSCEDIASFGEMGDPWQFPRYNFLDIFMAIHEKLKLLLHVLFRQYYDKCVNIDMNYKGISLLMLE